MLDNTHLGQRSQAFPGNVVTAGRQRLPGFASGMYENERFSVRGGR